MADNRTMAQMLQAPIEGYEDAIVVPTINANNFELKQTLINLVQSNQFTGKQDPHNHLRFFNKVTSTFRHPEVPNTSIKLLLFPFSLEGEARTWLDKEPPRSILTWDDLVSKFINQFFPPSKTTYLRNKITTFYQEPNETFNEAWERFKELLHALDSAAGGNFLDKMPREGLAIIESKSKVRYSRSRPNDSRAITNAPSSTSSPSNNSFEIQQMAALLEDKMNIRMSRLEKAISEKQSTPATVKAVEEVCSPTPQIQGVSKTNFENYVKANDAVLKNVQNQGQNLQNQMANVTSLLTSLCNNFKNSASISNSGTLPSQTVTNPREQINAITTRSGKTLEGPSTPLVPTPVVSNPQKELEQNLETSTEKVRNLNLENTAHVPPSEEEDSIFIEIPKPKAKKTVNVEIQDFNSPRPNSYQSKLLYPERIKVKENDKLSTQHSQFLKMFKQLRLEIGLKDTLVEMPKFYKWLSSLLRNKEKLEEITITTVNAECSTIIMNKVPEKLEDPGKFLIPCALQELNRTSALADSGASINLLPHSIYKKLRLEELTPTPTRNVVNFQPDPRVPIILGRPFHRTAKALIDLYEEKLTLRVGKEELVYYADKSKKNKIEEDKVSSEIPIDTIVMPIRITFENPIDFNDHFSKPKDFKKDLTVSFDSIDSSILPPPLLDSDSPFTAELSASVTLNSLGNEDKVFKPGILVYHVIHDNNLVTLEENLKENISSGTLLVFKETSQFLHSSPNLQDECLKNVVLHEDFYQSKKTLPLNVEDVDSFTFIIWTFLPYFTYTKESPLIFSFRSGNFVFDPRIVMFHKPVACSMKVFHLLSLRTNYTGDRVKT
ncbi:reverse transcriptase domain-containing protein [Tanacetum coccineum]|uniref:Reverse transcriptase domain-containing protein n=1 Tax=Tanacetum coccineum TaxID=301880 RepID=A0ABQ5GPB0_9ASTR